ncbi:zinc-binding alcohol dehydrogenase [Pseudalkalibacillus sp. A8]|uniref:zinc-dependent alcohol dehydrogenase n=1 Tax=Pseudalkalibacillus sp. A8 TaxID=3382641 RepID=UPI0038B461AF
MLNQVVTAKDFHVQLIELEVPKMIQGHVLIETEYSAISPGTECLAIESSENRSLHLGYSAVGKIIDKSDEIDTFQLEDRVACYGAPYVKHAKYLLVPKNLCAPVPDGVDSKEAALCGLGAIAIHALRKSDIKFGETVLVAGLGVLGQIIAQIGEAAAYQIIGFDLLEERSRTLAQFTNISSFHDLNGLSLYIEQVTQKKGVDHAVLCANGKNSTLIDDSLDLICDRGRINIVGDLEMHFSRSKLFAKEAEVFISRAGGPGRYDAVYERDGIDYPYGYVRWTEGRNIMEYIRLLRTGKIQMSPYTKDIIELADVTDAYREIQDKRTPALTKLIRF